MVNYLICRPENGNFLLSHWLCRLGEQNFGQISSAAKPTLRWELPHLDWHEVRERGRIAENLRRSIASIFTGHWVSQVETLGRIDRMNGFCPVLRESPHLQFRNHLEATLCRPEDETACHFCMKLASMGHQDPFRALPACSQLSNFQGRSSSARWRQTKCMSVRTNDDNWDCKVHTDMWGLDGQTEPPMSLPFVYCTKSQSTARAK